MVKLRTTTECESPVTAAPSDRFSGFVNVLEASFVGFMRAVSD
jgi:hypothetical protein